MESCSEIRRTSSVDAEFGSKLDSRSATFKVQSLQAEDIISCLTVSMPKALTHAYATLLQFVLLILELRPILPPTTQQWTHLEPVTSF
jgi:hypothetical protein